MLDWHAGAAAQQRRAIHQIDLQVSACCAQRSAAASPLYMRPSTGKREAHIHTHTRPRQRHTRLLALKLLRQRRRLSMITTPRCQMRRSQDLVSSTHGNKRACLDDVKAGELSSGSAGGGVSGEPESAEGGCEVGSVVSAAMPQGLAAVATLAQACTGTGTGQRRPSHLLTLGPGAGA